VIKSWKSADHFFGSSSGLGYPYKPGLPSSGKKKDYIRDVQRRFFKLCRLLATGEQVFNHRNIGMYVSHFKPETKCHTDEPGKVRQISQGDMDSEMSADLLDRPLMTYLQQLPWYSPGMSMFTSMISNTLLALGHKIYTRYKPQFQNPHFTEAFPNHRISYICLDQSSQDARFVKSTLELMYRLRVYGHDFKAMTQEDLRVFMQLLLHSDVTTFHKIIQWFDGAYYNQLQSNSSGDKFTTVANCVEQEFVLRVAITDMFMEKSPSMLKPWKVAQSLPIIICGDNSVLAVPDYLLDFFTTDRVYPDHLDFHLKKIGILLKKDETFIRTPKPSHQDCFFSSVDEYDNVTQFGVTYLQRIFVKIGRNNEILPADSNDYIKFGLHRATHHFFVKGMNHNFNWDHPSKNIAVALFQKTFSLLFDAGYNRTAHNYLRAILRLLHDDYDNIVDWCTDSNDLAELQIKVSFNNSWIRRVLLDDSFEFVTSKMSVSTQSAVLRLPVMDFRKKY